MFVWSQKPTGTLLRRRALAIGAVAATIACGALLPTTGAAAQARHAPPNAAGSRADVPWGRVGSGWTLATWAPNGGTSETLYLLNRTGTRYKIARLPRHDYLALWSPDAKHALLESDHGYRRVDLRTGHASRLHLPGGANSQPLAYTRPHGSALLAAVAHTRRHSPYLHIRLARVSLHGRLEQAYPTKVAGAGTLSTQQMLSTRSGSKLVVGARHGLVVLAKNGTVVRRLRPSTKQGCDAVSWWHRGIALANCAGRMWAVPVDGSTAKAVSAGPSKKDMFGYLNEWRYSRGRLGLAGTGCGPARLVRFGKSGHGMAVRIPSPTGKRGTPRYVGHYRNRVTMTFSRLGCQDSNATLFSYNAVTAHSTPLLGPAVNGGTVTSALALPGDE